MKKLFLFCLFLIAFLERTVYDLGPNVELITTAMILSSFYLGRNQAFWLTFAIMVTTDRIIGNSNIFLFTWSGFLIPSLVLSELFRNLKLEIRNFPWKVVGLTSTGLLSNLFFFMYTNLGVWLLGNMYTKNLQGLLLSYFYAIPFFKNQLVSTLIFVPLGFVIIEVSKKLLSNFSLPPAFLKLKKAFAN